MNNQDFQISGKISDPFLHLLLESLEKETNETRESEILAEIKNMTHLKERDAFLARFSIKDFDGWLNVLEEDEQSGYQSADFYIKPMLWLLRIWQSSKRLRHSKENLNHSHRF